MSIKTLWSKNTIAKKSFILRRKNMNFDRNTTKFPTMLHRDIYMTALRITPPEMSLAEINKTDPDLAKSGHEFYDFMFELLADMYNDPYSYGMNPGEYERFTNGLKYYAAKRKQPTKARTYYDQSSKELSSYLGLMKSIAIYCKIDNDKCVLSYEDFESLKKQDRAVPIETVMKMFIKTGLCFKTEADGSVTVINEKYPHMFAAMSALALAVENSIKNPISKSLKYFFAVNYDYLEFRQIFQNYKPGYDDVVRFLSDDGRAVVESLHGIAKEYKMRESYGYFFIEYQYKSKHIMTITTDGWWHEPHGSQTQWGRYIHVRLRGSSRPEYLRHVESYGEAFVKYFQQHLNYCVCCNPDHTVGSNGVRQVFGRNVRLCSPEIRGDIKGLTEKDLPYIKKYIDLRIESILAGEK